MNFLALGPYCYGKGTSIEEACKNAKKNWIPSYTGVKNPQNKHFSLWHSEGDFTVDDIGQVFCTKEMTKIQTSILADKK